MNEEVADFGENESEERQSGLEHVRRSVQRMIDQISDPRRETPVITAILKQITNGHGAVGKPMDKERLQIPFEVMESPAEKRRRNHWMTRRRGRPDAVNQRRTNVEQWEDEQRPGILAQKHGDPTDLRAQVFKVQSLDVGAQRAERRVVLQQLPFGVGLERDPFQRPVGSGLEATPQFLDGRIGGDVVEYGQRFPRSRVNDFHIHFQILSARPQPVFFSL